MSSIEKSVVQNKKLVYTIISYSVTIAIFANLSSLQSPLIGFIAFIMYFLINTVFLGNAFFHEESTFLRLTFGLLSLIMIIGSVGWLVMIIYDLDLIRVTLVLAIATTFSSMLNRRMKPRNVKC